MSHPSVRPHPSFGRGVRLVLADGRGVLDDVLTRSSGIAVVGQAADGDTAVHTVARLRPDVLLVDIAVPPVDGLQVCRKVAARRRSHALPTRVVIASTTPLDAQVALALTQGAAQLVAASGDPLLDALRTEALGDVLVTPGLAVGLPPPAGTAHPDRAVLTPREEEVVGAVAEGRTNAQIAAELFVTVGTVKTHLANIQLKLGASNRVGIARWAWAQGVVRPPR